MKMNELRRRIGGAALMLAMMIGITIAASETAQAQYRDYDRYGRYEDNRVRWSKDHERQYAFVLGYHNAYTEGRDAGNRVDYRSSRTYRNSDNGYRPWMGDNNTYRDSYRRGAEAGFKDGASGRARRYDRHDVERLLGARMVDVYGESDDNGWWGDRDRWDDRRDGRWDDRRDGRWDDRRNDRNDIYRIAQQNGYRDGVRHGQEDRSRNRRFDVDNSSDYRDASRGYRSEYGNREAYRNAYRNAFRQGYNDGYRNNRNNSRFPWPF